jgi:alpha-galactosidase
MPGLNNRNETSTDCFKMKGADQMIAWSILMPTSSGTKINRLSFSFLSRIESACGFRTLQAALLGIALLSLIAPRLVQAQSDKVSIRFNQQPQVFRIDAADMSYVLGINEKKQVQTLYWGKRLSNADSFAAAHATPGSSSFDLPINTTGQEFVAWGGGLYVEPDLKVTFPDGNRDLVLQYVSHTI